MRSKTAKRAGLLAACLHIAAFSATLLYIRFSRDPQASLIWVKWATFDFPVSLLYYLPLESYGTWVQNLDNSLLAQILYFPHLADGFVGTVLWYFLPRLCMPKRLGGIWGKPVKKCGNQ